MSSEKDEVLRKVDSHLRPLLDSQAKKGFEPYLVTFPSQDIKTKECRSCGATKAPGFGVTVAGRQLLDEKVYAYCIAMVCKTCAESKEKLDRFVDRVEERYRECVK
jgi:hypothetical protein